MSTHANPHPAPTRTSMPIENWAGHPLARIGRRTAGRVAPAARHLSSDPRPLMLRRVLLLAFVIAGAVFGTRAMMQILPSNGGTLAEQALLLLFGILFGWISAGFWTGLLGAWVLLGRRAPSTLLTDIDHRAPISEEISARTAIVMPICNEHVPTVFGGLQATCESLLATRKAGTFDVYILSDTNDPDIRAAEQAAWSELVARLAAGQLAGAVPLRVHYRWRQRRIKRKAGNVADFVRRWGLGYRYMVVLDADSVMTGDCLTTLVRLMEANPDAGILQTAPRACGHETLHARVLQFGARLYGPIFTAGMHFWQLGESHYWGHNAILRMKPFLDHCGLAPLPGTGSLSGEVLSHDFVEASLMRRAGWKVWVMHDLPGSYEQVPPNLLAELQRDRRWCHGNLQNSRLMFEPGLHAVHRSVFLTGVLAYASAPLWLGFLLLSTLLFTRQAHEVPIYFISPYQLFPIWPTADLKLMLTLFGLTGVLLLAPKVMAIGVTILQRGAWSFGGTARMLVSAFVEFVHSLLLAPVRMLFQTQFLVTALTGLRLDWKSPPRNDDSTTWGEAVRRHGFATLLAVVWIGAILASGASFPWWLSPILIGLLAGIPLSVLGSRSTVGRAFKRAGLLLIPEEIEPPEVLLEAERHASRYSESQAGFLSAVIDPEVQRRVVSANPVRPDARGCKADGCVRRLALALAEGPNAFDSAARMRLLSDATVLEAIRQAAETDDAIRSMWQAAPPRAAAAERRPLPPEMHLVAAAPVARPAGT